MGGGQCCKRNWATWWSKRTTKLNNLVAQSRTWWPTNFVILNDIQGFSQDEKNSVSKKIVGGKNNAVDKF